KLGENTWISHTPLGLALIEIDLDSRAAKETRWPAICVRERTALKDDAWKSIHSTTPTARHEADLGVAEIHLWMQGHESFQCRTRLHLIAGWQTLCLLPLIKLGRRECSREAADEIRRRRRRRRRSGGRLKRGVRPGEVRT